MQQVTEEFLLRFELLLHAAEMEFELPAAVASQQHLHASTSVVAGPAPSVLPIPPTSVAAGPHLTPTRRRQTWNGDDRSASPASILSLLDGLAAAAASSAHKTQQLNQSHSALVRRPPGGCTPEKLSDPGSLPPHRALGFRAPSSPLPPHAVAAGWAGAASSFAAAAVQDGEQFADAAAPSVKRLPMAQGLRIGVTHPGAGSEGEAETSSPSFGGGGAATGDGPTPRLMIAPPSIVHLLGADQPPGEIEQSPAAIAEGGKARGHARELSLSEPLALQLHTGPAVAAHPPAQPDGERDMGFAATECNLNLNASAMQRTVPVAMPVTAAALKDNSRGRHEVPAQGAKQQAPSGGSSFRLRATAAPFEPSAQPVSTDALVKGPRVRRASCVGFPGPGNSHPASMQQARGRRASIGPAAVMEAPLPNINENEAGFGEWPEQQLLRGEGPEQQFWGGVQDSRKRGRKASVPMEDDVAGTADQQHILL